MFFSKTLFSSIFGLAGVGVAGSIIAANVVAQPNKPNKLTLSEKCGFNEELEKLFDEIKKLYSDFKEKYQNSKEKISQEKVSKPISDSDFLKIDEDSCFNSYWNFSHSSLTPFISSILKSQDPDLGKLKDSAQTLDQKIEEFNTKNNKNSSTL